MDDGQFKTCPFCKEKIRASAIKCRYCGEWFETPPEATIPAKPEPHVDAETTSALPGEPISPITLSASDSSGQTPPLVPPPLPAARPSGETGGSVDTPLYSELPTASGDEKYMPPEVRREAERRSSVTDYLEHALEKRGGCHQNGSSDATEVVPASTSSQPCARSLAPPIERADHKHSRRYRYLLLLSTGIVGTCIGHSFEFNDPGAYTGPTIAGYFVGVLAAYGIILGMIGLILAALRGSVRRYWFPALAWLFLLAGLFDIAVKGYAEFILYPEVRSQADSQQKHEARQMLSGLQDQWSTIVESSTDSQGLPKHIDTPINTIPQAHGEFGEMERLIKEFMDGLASHRNDYIRDLEAIGWNGILDGARIEADNTFAESRAIVQKARELVKEHRERTHTLLANTRQKIQSLDVSQATRNEMLSGFDEGMEVAKENIETLWSLEGEIITEFESMINLLSAEKGAWVVRNGQVQFYSDADLNRFNAYIASIRALSERQQEMQSQSRQHVDHKFDELKEATK